MRLLKEIVHKPNLLLDGRTTMREAVRAIILKEKQVLMVFSPVNGDYKFPGGGIQDGEERWAALAREIKEECGTKLIKILDEFGKMIELDLAEEEEFDLFKMTSYYYLCEVEDSFGEQNLDDYEYEYGFRPEWVSLEHAIAVNRALLEDPPPNIQRWVSRELFVLEELEKFENKINH
ncbi:MAG: NUDIX domain-containing protein [Anaerolineaceae bacterium]|nr:NUDIX domain-containing protein [Anaerolineaceae bacterium]